MTLKRVLVLVMALVMVVSTCATPVLAAFNPETHHEHLHDVIDNPEYKEQYEEIKSTVEDIVKDIEENHEEYYSNGYEYALKKINSQMSYEEKRKIMSKKQNVVLIDNSLELCYTYKSINELMNEREM